MRFPSRTWLAVRGTPFIHGGVSRVSLIPNTRLVKSAQPCVRNGADTCLRRFYYDVLGKSKKNFLLQLEGGHGNHKGTADVVASPALWRPSHLASKKRRRHEKIMPAPPATTPSSACLRALLPEGQSVISSVIIGLIASVALLVASLVSFLVFVFLKVVLLVVVPLMRLVILAFAQPLLVILVFRIILVLACAIHCRRRHSARLCLP